MSIKSKIKKVINASVSTGYKLLHKFIKVDEKCILFISHHGRGYSCNPKYIHKYLVKDDRFNDYKFIWAVKKGINVDIPNGKIVKYLGIKYFYYLARSKYWIFNCKMPKYVLKKENQIYVQTWHGTPLKKLAHDIQIGDNATFYRSEITRSQMTKSYDDDAKKYNYFISPNEFSTEKFKTSFRVSDEIIIETGYPRNDYLTNIEKIDTDSIKAKLGIPLNKKVILYAPTWRDNSYNTKGYTFKLEVNFDLWKKTLEEEYIVIFKPHYLIVNKYNEDKYKGFIYNIDPDVDINDLYVISDILITDYSSVFFDFAILKRPILFYMYDLENYRDNLRGFYLDIYKDLPGSIIESEEELLNKIVEVEKEDYTDKINQFNDRFNNLQDGNVSKKVVEKIFL